jgi:hypothetical protein
MEIVPIAQVQVMAKSVVQSGLFGLKNQDQAFTLMLIAQAEGIHPIQAIQKYSIINGMPSLKSTEIQSRFQKSGGIVKWVETSNTKAVCEMSHPSYDGKYLSEFTIADATLMGLVNKDNWKKMPKQMLMARCISAGVRAVYPDCLNNMYSEAEVQDIEVTEVLEPEAVVIDDKQNNKQILTMRLRKLDFSDAMIKEFATKYNLANDEVLLQTMIDNNEKLIELIEEFEDDN